MSERRDRVRTITEWERVLHIKVQGEVNRNDEYSELEFERLIESNGVITDPDSPFPKNLFA